MKIGFIGQGWIGKNYADNFEERGYDIVRYAKEPEYVDNKDLIADCDIVLIAVPTPTTKEGFSDAIIRDVIKLVGKGKIAVIKSTIVPGTTQSIQKENPDILVMHSPEFLAEASARYDADNPNRNIIGIPVMDEKYKKAAKQVMEVLPKAPYELICEAKTAEMVKYGNNVFLYFKVLFANLLYDLSAEVGADYDIVKDAIAADPRIGSSHLTPVHKSGHSDIPGRGAGGECFIKDFKSFLNMYREYVNDAEGIALLEGLESKNNKLLRDSKKDLDLLEGVYGE